jgi:hypothetical protein
VRVVVVARVGVETMADVQVAVAVVAEKARAGTVQEEEAAMAAATQETAEVVLAGLVVA